MFLFIICFVFCYLPVGCLSEVLDRHHYPTEYYTAKWKKFNRPCRSKLRLKSIFGRSRLAPLPYVLTFPELFTSVDEFDSPVITVGSFDPPAVLNLELLSPVFAFPSTLFPRDAKFPA